MKILLICIILYFASSDHGVCNAREAESLAQIISFLAENEEFITQNINVKKSTSSTIFSVLDYGAKADGATKDAEAFVKTWSEACKVNGGVMLVPTGYTFLLQALDFDGGSCQPNIVVQVDGKIVAPPKTELIDKQKVAWIQFQNVTKGLTIKGNGIIDGRGESWWADKGQAQPHSVRITGSSNVIVTGIKIQNSPKFHIFIEQGQYLKVYNFTVSSPGNSPNTDGIHVSRFKHVEIHNNTIACGDDCVSIQTGCSDVKIYDVYCGPGHGYSIGGLGFDQTEAEVSDISVFDSKVQNALNGVRIKTWPGGSGYARNVKFSNIQMIDVKTPIVIDQHYCGGPKCTVAEQSAVAVSNITYEKITGTFTYRSVSLDCSLKVPCTDLTISSINLSPSPTEVKSAQEIQCLHAYGRVLTKTTPPLENCLLSGGAPSLETQSSSPMSTEFDFLI